MDDYFRFEYDAAEVARKLANSAKDRGYDEGVEVGIQTGIETGTQKKTKEIVLNLASMKYAISDIAKITGTSVKDVKRIINA